MAKKLSTAQDLLHIYLPKKRSLPIRFLLYLLKILSIILSVYLISGMFIHPFVVLFTHGTDDLILNLGNIFISLSVCIPLFFYTKLIIEREKIRKKMMVPKVKEIVKEMKDLPFEDIEEAVLNFANSAHLELTQKEKRFNKFMGKYILIGSLTLIVLIIIESTIF